MFYIMTSSDIFSFFNDLLSSCSCVEEDGKTRRDVEIFHHVSSILMLILPAVIVTDTTLHYGYSYRYNRDITVRFVHRGLKHNCVLSLAKCKRCLCF